MEFMTPYVKAFPVLVSRLFQEMFVGHKALHSHFCLQAREASAFMP